MIEYLPIFKLLLKLAFICLPIFKINIANGQENYLTKKPNVLIILADDLGYGDFII